MDLFAVKVDGSEVNPGICFVTSGCFNVQTSHEFENFCLFSSNSTYSIRFRIKRYIFSMSIIACFHYKTDSWVDVTPVTFNSKKVHEDKIFDRQDILQFFSEVSKDYKYVKPPNMR